MLLMKFGGTSVGDAERIRNVFEIVSAAKAKHPVVVASAHKGVTDLLFDAARTAATGTVKAQKIREIHQRILTDLGLDVGLLDKFLSEVEVLLKGISLVRELTPRTLDYVASFGERMSTRTLAEYFNRQGYPAVAVDAFDLGLLTDSNFGNASPLPEGDALMLQNIKKYDRLPIVTGYIGKDKNGDITTLGRNGSDYSASIVGAAIDAEEIQIWTDVDGVMTADPRLVKDAKPIDVMSFDEASELAYYGGKVLHPYTLIPAVRKGIPVRVLNTFKPSAKGTVVLREPAVEGVVKSIAYKRNLYLINIVSTRMLYRAGFMSEIFETFGKHQIVIDMIATSEVSVSLTVDSDRNLEPAIQELSEFAEVTVEPEKAIVCVVGEGMRSASGIERDVFDAMKQAGINVQMISQGATRINLAFLIENKEVPSAVAALHDMFFGNGRRRA